MKISLLQTYIHWENPSANYSAIEKLLDEISATDMIILPEMWTTGFTMNNSVLSERMDGPSIKMMIKWADEKEALIMGSVIIKENGSFYNRCITAFPDGKIEIYDKRHLFSFAKEDQHYAKGTSNTLIEYKGWKILPQICYDLRFPSWSRYSKIQDFDLLLYMANWPARRISAWSKMLESRAIENQAYCIGVNRVGMDGNDVYYNGRTAAIDYTGDPIVILPTNTNIGSIEINLKDLRNFRRKFPFLKDRDVK